jgi:hypothetical protein
VVVKLQWSEERRHSWWRAVEIEAAVVCGERGSARRG